MSKQIFYSYAGSPNVWRVAVYLHEKGLKPETRVIDLIQKEQKNSEYLAINSRGQVPAYQEGDVVIAESLAIMMYLEHKHKETPLIPTNDQDYATFLTRYFQFPAKLDQVGILGPVLFGKKTRADLEDKIQALLKETKEWDSALEGREYLAHTFSIADIAILPTITSYVETLGLEISQFPNLQAWYKRMWLRPAVKETPSHALRHKEIPHERVLEGVRL